MGEMRRIGGIWYQEIRIECGGKAVTAGERCGGTGDENVI